MNLGFTNYLLIFCFASALLGLGVALAQENGRKKSGEAQEQALPSTGELQKVVDAAYAKFKSVKDGKNANYIPALDEVPSDLFGIAIVTRDGVMVSAGESDYRFSMQSCSKVFTLCAVLTEDGADEVYEKINVEPTGEKFNSIQAIEEGDGRADNPLVNAGAIAAVSLIDGASKEEKWTKILDTYRMFANADLEVIDPIYESEKATNHRNRAIASLLYNSGHLYADPMESTDVYTMQCSVGVSTKELATMGGVLANYGVNPASGKECLSEAHVSKVLAMMMMAGFYDGSGAWAWKAGLPAKTGVSGCVLAVVPGEMAIAAFSPPLDANGNSVRAQEAIAYISEELNLNLFTQ